MFNDFVHLNNNNHDDANRGSSSKPTEVVWEKGHENQTCGGETLAIISIVSASVVILFLLLLLLPCSWIVWESPLCAFLISLFFFFTIELACLCSTLPCNYFFYMHLKNIVCAFHFTISFFSAWSLTSINCFSLFFFFFSCFLMPSFVSS